MALQIKSCSTNSSQPSRRRVKYNSCSSTQIWLHCFSISSALTDVNLTQPLQVDLIPQLALLKHLKEFSATSDLPFAASLLLLCLTPSARSLQSLNLEPALLEYTCVGHIIAFQNLRSLSLCNSNLSQPMLDRICEASCRSLHNLNLYGVSSIVSLKKIGLCMQLKDLNIGACVGLGSDELQHLTGLENLVSLTW